MHIDKYDFGHMTIDGTAYNSDLIIFPDKVIPNWWREEGHQLRLNDLKEVFKANPKVLIVGCGYNGVMKVTKEVTDYCKTHGIDLKATKSTTAVNEYNSLEKKEAVICTFHLTC